MSAQSLKPGWKMVRFGDIAQNVAVRVDPADAKTDVYVGLEHLDPSTIHLRQWGHPSDVTGQKLAFKKGDVIFGRRRAYQRKLAVAEFDGICSAHAMVVRAKPKMILPEFLPFFLQSDMFMERAIEISVGSLSPTINWKTLKVQEFPLPPFDEQKRIAEILWAADEAVETKRDALNKANESISVLSAHILTEGFGFHPPKKTAIGSLHSGWDVVRLGDVANVVYGITLNSKRNALPLKKPYLRVANVQRDSFDLNDVNLIGCTEKEASQYRLQQGDILVVEGHADVNEIGRASLWRDNIDGCLHQNHLLRVRCSAKLIPEFALAWLNSPRGRSYFRRMAQSTSGLNTINSTVLKKSLLPLPDTKTQQEIINILTIHNVAIRLLREDIEELHELRNQLVRKFVPVKIEGAAHV